MAFPFPQRHSGLSGDRDAADRREVMLGWPADALNQATNRVLYLSGMLDNRHDADPEQTGKAEATEPVTSKKHSKAS
ncbi:phage tail protein [Escherichia coli]